MSVLFSLPPDDGRPLLLMDVDGVLNALSRSNNAKVYDIFKAGSEKAKPFTIRFRRDLAGWLAELAAHYHLVWCTTWDDDANREFSARLGLGTLPVIPTVDSELPRHKELLADLPKMIHWKVPVIVNYVGERPYAWIDDGISPVDQSWAAVRTRNVAPTKHLPIRPDSGLLRHHVDKLIAWAGAL